MKVLVTLPNGRTTYCVECLPKAIGRECLEKVCHEQNIQCETEYFGLVCNPRSQRNSSDHNASGSLLDPLDAAVPSVSPSSSSAQNDQTPSGQSLAADHDSTASSLTTTTTTTTPRVRQWLNLRNPIGRCDGGFLSLALRVKFWVPVHLILQESVRNLFYMEARQELLENRIFASDWPNAIKLAALLAHGDGLRFNPECLEESSRAKIANNSRTLLANQSNNMMSVVPAAAVDPLQRRRGSKRKSSSEAIGVLIPPVDAGPLSVYEPYTLVRPRNQSCSSMSKEKLLCGIAEEHKKYADQLPKSAKYWLLAEFGKLKGFGEEKFFVPKVEVDGVPSQVEITVGPEGLGVVHAKGDERQEIPFSAIQRASSKNRTFRLKYWNQANKEDELVLKMSPTLCAALYRAVTEKHDFYSCETVRTTVTTQFIRDFKGTFLSIFNEDTELGKKYVFDIQRTCREVHDHARRYLHNNGIVPAGPAIGTGDQSEGPVVNSSAAIQEEVNRQIADIICCKICMDPSNTIDALFASCGHVVSCLDCAKKCDRCPICRTEVSSICKLYLPSELRTRTK